MFGGYLQTNGQLPGFHQRFRISNSPFRNFSKINFQKESIGVMFAHPY